MSKGESTLTINPYIDTLALSLSLLIADAFGRRLYHTPKPIRTLHSCQYVVPVCTSHTHRTYRPENRATPRNTHLHASSIAERAGFLGSLCAEHLFGYTFLAIIVLALTPKTVSAHLLAYANISAKRVTHTYPPTRTPTYILSDLKHISTPGPTQN